MITPPRRIVDPNGNLVTLLRLGDVTYGQQYDYGSYWARINGDKLELLYYTNVVPSAGSSVTYNYWTDVQAFLAAIKSPLADPSNTCARIPPGQMLSQDTSGTQVQNVSLNIWNLVENDATCTTNHTVYTMMHVDLTPVPPAALAGTNQTSYAACILVSGNSNIGSDAPDICPVSQTNGWFGWCDFDIKCGCYDPPPPPPPSPAPPPPPCGFRVDGQMVYSVTGDLYGDFGVVGPASWGTGTILLSGGRLIITLQAADWTAFNNEQSVNYVHYDIFKTRGDFIREYSYDNGDGRHCTANYEWSMRGFAFVSNRENVIVAQSSKVAYLSFGADTVVDTQLVPPLLPDFCPATTSADESFAYARLELDCPQCVGNPPPSPPAPPAPPSPCLFQLSNGSVATRLDAQLLVPSNKNAAEQVTMSLEGDNLVVSYDTTYWWDAYNTWAGFENQYGEGTYCSAHNPMSNQAPLPDYYIPPGGFFDVINPTQTLIFPLSTWRSQSEGQCTSMGILVLNISISGRDENIEGQYDSYLSYNGAAVNSIVNTLADRFGCEAGSPFAYAQFDLACGCQPPNAPPPPPNHPPPPPPLLPPPPPPDAPPPPPPDAPPPPPPDAPPPPPPTSPAPPPPPCGFRVDGQIVYSVDVELVADFSENGPTTWGTGTIVLSGGRLIITLKPVDWTGWEQALYYDIFTNQGDFVSSFTFQPPAGGGRYCTPPDELWWYSNQQTVVDTEDGTQVISRNIDDFVRIDTCVLDMYIVLAAPMGSEGGGSRAYLTFGTETIVNTQAVPFIPPDFCPATTSQQTPFAYVQLELDCPQCVGNPPPSPPTPPAPPSPCEFQLSNGSLTTRLDAQLLVGDNKVASNQVTMSLEGDNLVVRVTMDTTYADYGNRDVYGWDAYTTWAAFGDDYAKLDEDGVTRVCQARNVWVEGMQHENVPLTNRYVPPGGFWEVLAPTQTLIFPLSTWRSESEGQCTSMGILVLNITEALGIEGSAEAFLSLNGAAVNSQVNTLAPRFDCVNGWAFAYAQFDLACGCQPPNAPPPPPNHPPPPPPLLPPPPPPNTPPPPPPENPPPPPPENPPPPPPENPPPPPPENPPPPPPENPPPPPPYAPPPPPPGVPTGCRCPEAMITEYEWTHWLERRRLQEGALPARSRVLQDAESLVRIELANAYQSWTYSTEDSFMIHDGINPTITEHGSYYMVRTGAGRSNADGEWSWSSGAPNYGQAGIEYLSAPESGCECSPKPPPPPPNTPPPPPPENPPPPPPENPPPPPPENPPPPPPENPPPPPPENPPPPPPENPPPPPPENPPPPPPENPPPTASREPSTAASREPTPTASREPAAPASREPTPATSGEPAAAAS
ncbi:hypothetical protein HYH03_011563 [Edaphochlamys debaryana]|uniref:Uncharacterized protein n=1 Tax=Edaphochlamys debaryana TaxID=47281 RepID=A0A836BVD3_9CHLO|nr:hypothetical protein HYH03_011563 [Edaphochlamys debaryana]|eukprot:KAG2489927.1 hypothetical protein HYH03_011563 [Edaphochlamys debaryana]